MILRQGGKWAPEMQAPIQAAGKPEKQKGYGYAFDETEIRRVPAATIRRRLCDAGPGYCETCGLCAYGREWLRREAAGC